ncbi:MAG: hypothetical protein HQL58_09555 [Magnetococcales bacterium]|nr:hypothetical protein [Magnetococcales bacterium]
MIITSMTTLPPSAADLSVLRQLAQRLQPTAEQLVNRLDGDGDDRISRDEAQETRLESRFQDDDRDSDGLISTDELRSAMDTFRQQIRAHQLQSPVMQPFFPSDGSDEEPFLSDSTDQTSMVDQVANMPDSLSYHLAMLQQLIDELPSQIDLTETDSTEAALSTEDLSAETSPDATESADSAADPSNTVTLSPDEIMAMLDQNGNGAIGLDEASKVLSQRFRAADADGDEQISMEELVSDMERANAAYSSPDEAADPASVDTPPSPTMTAEDILAALDRDSNGAIGREEALGTAADRFKIADADGDDQISLDELTYDMAGAGEAYLNPLPDPTSGPSLDELKQDLSYHLDRVQQLIDGISAEPDQVAEVSPEQMASDESIDNPTLGINTLFWPSMIDQMSSDSGEDSPDGPDSTLASEVLPSETLQAGLSSHITMIQRLIDSLSGQGETAATPISPAQTIAAMDEDGNGAIGPQEATGTLAQNFTVADADGDGQISEEELASHIANNLVEPSQDSSQPPDGDMLEALPFNMAPIGNRSFGMTRYLSMIQQLASGASQYLVQA